jgi:hypothetical protein
MCRPARHGALLRHFAELDGAQQIEAAVRIRIWHV